MPEIRPSYSEKQHQRQLPSPPDWATVEEDRSVRASDSTGSKLPGQFGLSA
jgi:hypothetical protein